MSNQMQELNFNYGEKNGCIVDPILYNRFDDVSKSDFIINITLNETEINKLSQFVWTVYQEVLDDFLDEEFDYFDDGDEPFPTSPETIIEKPELIDQYIKESNLWRDNIMNRFLFPWDESKSYDCFIVGYCKTTFKDNNLILSFYAVINRNKK